jgi:hypothetical protein
MIDVSEPNAEAMTSTENSNAELLLDAGEQIVSQTIEYTEGSNVPSPYFIPSSLCD